jgi:signal transduction histidine kinase
LHASRKRLLLAADAERRRIERELHEGVQQHFVALAVNLQLASELTDSDPAAAKTLLAEMSRDVQQALDETAQLAQRIYPPLDAVGLAATLRSAAVSAGVRASVDVEVRASYPREVVAAVYWCWLEMLECAADGMRAAVRVRDEDGALTFEVVGDGDRSAPALESSRDRVEALGGRLTIRSEPGRGTRVSGSLPLAG